MVMVAGAYRYELPGDWISVSPLRSLFLTLVL